MKIASRQIIVLFISSVIFALFDAQPVEAKPAKCFTTDDGAYPCKFELVEFNGSFAISAPDKPTYMLILDAPGYAFGFVNFGNRDIALPGPYKRETDDPACWANLEIDTRICAW